MPPAGRRRLLPILQAGKATHAKEMRLGGEWVCLIPQERPPPNHQQVFLAPA